MRRRCLIKMTVLSTGLAGCPAINCKGRQIEVPATWCYRRGNHASTRVNWRWRRFDETPLGTYRGFTDQVVLSRTPGAFRTVLVPRGSSTPEWLA